MPRQMPNTDDTTTAQLSLQDELQALIEQQGDLGRRIIVLATRAETEIADLKVEKEASAAELAEARAELVELRAAHEIEMQKRTEAEARVVRLKAAIATIRAECDAIDDQDGPTPGENTTGPMNAEPIAPGAEKLAEHLGLTETDLAAVDLLVRRGDAPDRTTMLATLVRRGLAVGAFPVDARLGNGRDHGEGAHAARR